MMGARTPPWPERHADSPEARVTPRPLAVLACLAVVAAGALTPAGASASTRAPASPAPVAAVQGDDDFYTPPSDLGGRSGRVLKQEPSTFYLDPARTVPAPAVVQRIMYTSRDAHGRRTAVTGTLLTPVVPWQGPGERPLISFAVGTQGMADRCAPSRQLAAGQEYEGAFLSGFLARGYTVVVTDYEGLGTPGVHAYVNSRALGNNVLDAARAATRVETDPVTRTAPVYLAGYSEGGNAVGGALQRHATYAPGVPLAGGYAGAVPADLARVAPPLDGSLYTTFLLYSVAALDAGYPRLGVGDLLNRRGRQAVRRAARTCTADGLAPFAFADTSTYTRSGRSLTSLLARRDVARVLRSLRVGTVAPDVPVIVAHSRLDDVVDFGQDRDAVRRWCRLGATVAFRPGVAPTHVGGAVESYPQALAWIEARVGSVPAPSSCERWRGAR